MIRNLKNSQTSNKKGGCMLRKVLSVFVICSLMFSNACFAMPAVAQMGATVDNMALRSFLEDGVLTTDQGDFVSMLTTLTNKTYNAEDAKAIFNMWSSVKGTDVATRVAAAQKEIPQVSLDGDKVVIDINPQGRSSKATSEANLASLDASAQQAVADGKTTEVTADQKNKDRADLEAMLAVGNISESRKQEILNAFDSRGLYTMAPVVMDMDNRLHGMSTADASYIDENLTGTARTDLILHETLESLNGNDDAKTMTEQMAIHNLDENTRKDAESTMGQTRKAMADSAAKVLAAEEAKTPSDKVAINKDFLNKDKTDPAAQAEAMEIAKKAFAGDTDKLAKAKADDLVGMIQDLMQKKMNEITSNLSSALGTLIPASKQTDTDEQVAVLAENVAALKDGEVLAMDYDMLFTTKNGKVVPRVGATILFDSLNSSKVKDGAIQVISAQNVQGAQDALGYMFPELGKKVTVNAGNEGSLAVVNTNPALLRVLYTSETSIEGGIADVSYIKGPKMDKVDGLQVLVAALAPNLKAVDQSILIDLGDGKFELGQMEIDDAAYEQMEAAYEEVVNILIQA